MSLEDITTYTDAIAEIDARETTGTPLSSEELKQIARQMDTTVGI